MESLLDLTLQWRLILGCTKIGMNHEYSRKALGVRVSRRRTLDEIYLASDEIYAIHRIQSLLVTLILLNFQKSN